MSDDIEWYTPQHVIDAVVYSTYCEDGITLDPCWSPDSLVRPKIAYASNDDGLSKDWSIAGKGLIFVNPPYGRKHNAAWARKISEEGSKAAQRGGELMALLPVSTGSEWFHEILESCDEVFFIKGRIRFIGRKDITPTFDSCIAFYGYTDYLLYKKMRFTGIDGRSLYG